MATISTTYSCGHVESKPSLTPGDKTWAKSFACNPCSSASAMNTAQTARAERTTTVTSQHRPRGCECASGAYGGVCTCC